MIAFFLWRQLSKDIQIVKSEYLSRASPSNPAGRRCPLDPRPVTGQQKPRVRGSGDVVGWFRKILWNTDVFGLSWFFHCIYPCWSCLLLFCKYMLGWAKKSVIHLKTHRSQLFHVRNYMDPNVQFRVNPLNRKNKTSYNQHIATISAINNSIESKSRQKTLAETSDWKISTIASGTSSEPLIGKPECHLIRVRSPQEREETIAHLRSSHSNILFPVVVY